MGKVISFENYKRTRAISNSQSVVFIIHDDLPSEEAMNALLAEGLACVDQFESIGNLVNRVIEEARLRAREREKDETSST